jgi:hypothetical protein
MKWYDAKEVKPSDQQIVLIAVNDVCEESYFDASDGLFKCRKDSSRKLDPDAIPVKWAAFTQPSD